MKLIRKLITYWGRIFTDDNKPAHVKWYELALPMIICYYLVAPPRVNQKPSIRTNIWPGSKVASV